MMIIYLPLTAPEATFKLMKLCKSLLNILPSSCTILQYNKIDQGKMGSSPSYESQSHLEGNAKRKSRHLYHPNKESLRSSKNHPQQGDVDQVNPEQKEAPRENQNEGGPKEIERPFTPFQPQNEEKQGTNSVIKNPNEIRRNNPQTNYEEIAKSNIPQKKTAKQVEPDEQEEEYQPQERNVKGKQRYHYPIKGKGIEESEQTSRVKEHQKRRNYVKQSTNGKVETGSASKQLHRKNEEIDYHEYDSAHIRHKAIQQIHEQEHPIHAIKHKEPIYEHEKLYPKILKYFHKEKEPQEHPNASNNRHVEHEFNVEEEYYEQPHKPHLYKRLRIPMPHEEQQLHQEEEQHRPQGKGARKEHPNLQKSMNLREAPNSEQIHEIRKSLNVKQKNPQQNTKRRGGSIHEQEEEHHQVPANANANFRKRKHEQNLQQAQKQLEQFESKSIAELNKENEFNVTEFNVDPLELVTCRQGCGRKFQADRIEKHETICRKVFQQKRKEFNAQQQRIVSKQQKKLLKKGMAQDKDNHRKKIKIPKWKAQSIALRAHIKMGLDEQYTPNQEEMEMLSQQQHIDVVNCPYCGRNFNKNSAKTHVPFCKGKYEKEMEKERFEKKPIKSRR